MKAPDRRRMAATSEPFGDELNVRFALRSSMRCPQLGIIRVVPRLYLNPPLLFGGRIFYL